MTRISIAFRIATLSAGKNNSKNIFVEYSYIKYRSEACAQGPLTYFVLPTSR